MAKKRPGKIHVINELCKECSICVHFCPHDAIAFSETFNTKGYHPIEIIRENCTVCTICYKVCPDSAIEVHDEKNVMEG